MYKLQYSKLVSASVADLFMWAKLPCFHLISCFMTLSTTDV